MPVYESPSGRAKNSGRFSLLVTLENGYRESRTSTRRKRKKIKSLIVRKKIGQNCRLSINKRESFLNADKNTLNAKSLFYSRFIY